jgi:hypothetical protein
MVRGVKTPVGQLRAAGLAVALLALALPGGAGARGTVPAQPVWGAPVWEGALPAEASEATEVLTVDLNGDGLTDAVVDPVNSSFGNQVVPVAPVFLINHGNGRFTNETSKLFEGRPPLMEWGRELLTADFNGDGRPDIFIADHGHVNDADPNQVRKGAQQHLILSTPDGHYIDASKNLPQQLTFTHSAAVADVNGDGAPDIFENNIPIGPGDPGPQILLNDGTGHFSVEPDAIHEESVDPFIHPHSFACAFADVNGDGSPDLVIGAAEDKASAASQVLLNDGQGHFTFFETLPPTLGPPENAFVIDMKAADVNGDGAPDLIFGETLNDPWYVGTTVQVLMNDGHGQFTDETSTRFPVEPHAKRWPQRVLVNDVDGDGRPDVTIEFANAGADPKDPTAVYLDRAGVFRRIRAPVEGPVPESGGPVGWVNGDGAHALLSIEFRTLDQAVASSYYVTPELTVPAPPTRVQAVWAGRSVRITWTRVAQATRYQVWRGGKLVATTIATSFLDRKPTGRAVYSVRSENPAGAGAGSVPVHLPAPR